MTTESPVATPPAAAATAAPAAPAADAGKGLLDDVKATPDTPVNPDPNASTASHIAEDPTKAAQAAAAAKRERPANVPEKFWDKEKGEPKVEDMAKSYAELEKNFKLGKHKAPEGGKYDTTPFDDKVKADDPLMSKYTEWAGKYGLSQAAYEELVGTVIEVTGGAEKETQISRTQEMEALGPQAQAIIDSMATWARGFVSSGVWTAEDFEEFKVMGGTANGIRALMRVRESYEGRVPLKDTIPSDMGLSDEELHARVGHPDYQTNKGGFRDKTEQLFERRYGGSVRAA